MEVKVYFNRKFPMSLITSEINITTDLEYQGSLILKEDDEKDILGYLQETFYLLQLSDDIELLELPLDRSLSVGDVLSIKQSFWEYPVGDSDVIEATVFYKVDHVGFKLL